MPRKSQKQRIYETLATVADEAAALQRAIATDPVVPPPLVDQVDTFMDGLWKACVTLDIRFTERVIEHNRSLARALQDAEWSAAPFPLHQNDAEKVAVEAEAEADAEDEDTTEAPEE